MGQTLYKLRHTETPANVFHFKEMGKKSHRLRTLQESKAKIFALLPSGMGDAEWGVSSRQVSGPGGGGNSSFKARPVGRGLWLLKVSSAAQCVDVLFGVLELHLRRGHSKVSQREEFVLNLIDPPSARIGPAGSEVGWGPASLEVPAVRPREPHIQTHTDGGLGGLG